MGTEDLIEMTRMGVAYGKGDFFKVTLTGHNQPMRLPQSQLL